MPSYLFLSFQTIHIVLVGYAAEPLELGEPLTLPRSCFSGGIHPRPAPGPAGGSSGDAGEGIDPPPSRHLSPRCLSGLTLTSDGSLAALHRCRVAVPMAVTCGNASRSSDLTSLLFRSGAKFSRLLGCCGKSDFSDPTFQPNGRRVQEIHTYHPAYAVLT